MTPAEARHGTWRTALRTLLAVLLVSGLLAGCGLFGGTPGAPMKTTTLTVTSPAFRDGGRLPTRYTCRGEKVSPPLRWSGAPVRAKSLALVVDDPDATAGTFVHWVVIAIPPDVLELAEGTVPQGAMQARNSAGSSRYVPPCPAKGVHHYRFTVYALSAVPSLGEGASLRAAIAAISRTAIARGRVTSTYGS